MRKPILFLLLSLITSCAIAAVDSDVVGDDLEQGSELGGPAMTRGQASGSPPYELAASVDGLTVQVSPIAVVEHVDGATVWRVNGRASVDLAGVASWVPDDAFGSAELTGARAFSISFREPSDQNTIASGLPVFLSVTPAAGAPAEAALWFRPRLQASAGTGRVRFYSIVKPVWLAGDVVYRGKVAIDPGRPEGADWRVSVVSSPAPATSPLGSGRTRLEWTFDTLAATVARAPGLVQVQARRDAMTLERSASLELRAIRLGLTRDDPRDVWPRVCKEAVRACLAALPADAIDAEACGTYREVLACGGPQGARSTPRPD